MSDHDAHALVELLAEAADLLGVLGELLLLPAVIGRAQERIERGRRGHHDLLGHAVLDQPAVGVRRGGRERFSRDEHDDEVRRLGELLLVGLGGQRVHVLAHLLGVATQRLAPVSLGGGGHGVEVTVRRRPLGRWTTMSGLSRPVSVSVVTCST